VTRPDAVRIAEATESDVPVILELIHALAADLFVKPEHRGQGIGRTLLAHVAGVAVARGAGRMEWSVLATKATKTN
jgi:GNAT superfamily N-acetyltransferase